MFHPRRMDGLGEIVDWREGKKLPALERGRDFFPRPPRDADELRRDHHHAFLDFASVVGVAGL